MKTRFLFLIACSLLGIALAGCLASGPTVNTPATEAVIMTRIFATLTAIRPRSVSEPSATPAPSATPVPPTVPAPTRVAFLSPTPVPPTFTPVGLSPTPLPTAEPSPVVASQGAMATLRSDQVVNVRTGPGIGYSVIGGVRKGDKLPVTGRTTDSSWLKITLPDGRSGWILANMAQLNVPDDKVPVDLAMPTPPAAAATP